MTAVIEFSVGHARDGTRAARILNVIEQMPVTVDLGRRAADLLIRVAASGASGPSVVDATVAALGEIHARVVTGDPADMKALASAGHGYEIFSINELLTAMEP